MRESAAIHALVAILENPWAEKTYRQLRDFYSTAGLEHEATSIDYLIEKKFHVLKNSPTDPKQ